MVLEIGTKDIQVANEAPRLPGILGRVIPEPVDEEEQGGDFGPGPIVIENAVDNVLLGVE